MYSLSKLEVGQKTRKIDHICPRTILKLRVSFEKASVPWFRVTPASLLQVTLAMQLFYRLRVCMDPIPGLLTPRVCHWLFGDLTLLQNPFVYALFLPLVDQNWRTTFNLAGHWLIETELKIYSVINCPSMLPK
jgi:hypothetical protein